MSESSAVSRNSRGPVIAPDQLISILLGADKVTMSGFCGESPKLPFWIPLVSSTQPGRSGAANKAVQQKVNWVFKVSLALGCIALVLLSFWAGTLSTKAINASTTKAAWVAKGVEKNAVSYALGSSRISFQVGSMLPSGEILRSVDSHRQSFTTDSQITVVKP